MNVALRLITLTLALGALVFSGSARGQALNLVWHNLSSFDARAISAGANTSEGGTFWIVGTGGLHRYEAQTQEWATYTTADGLPKIWASAVHPMPEAVWIGFEDGGAARFDRQSGRAEPFLQFVPSDPITVRAIQASGEDDVWLGADRGLYRVSRSSLDTLAYYTREDDGLGSDYVRDLADDDLYVWAATTFGGVVRTSERTSEVGGLSRIRKETGAVQNFTLPEEGSSAHFAALAQGGEDTLWVGGREGLFVFNKQSETFTGVTPDSVRRVTDILVGERYVWFTAIPTAPAFLFRLNRATLQIEGSPLRLPEPFFGSSARTAGLSADASAVYVARGEHLLRVSKQSPGNYTSISVPLLPYPYADALTLGPETAYVGTNNALIAINQANVSIAQQVETFEETSKKTRVIRADGNSLWLGTHDGLLRYNRTTLEREETLFDDQRVEQLAVGSDYIWASPGQGLYLIDRGTNQVAQQRTFESELDTVETEPAIQRIVLDGETVWVSASTGPTAQQTGYLIKLDRTTLAVQEARAFPAGTGRRMGAFVRQGEHLLLGGATVYSVDQETLASTSFIDQRACLLRQHGNHLWAVHGCSPTDDEGGVTVFDVDTQEPLVELSESNGLLHNYVTDMQLAEDYSRAWFATYAGVSVLNISSVEALSTEGSHVPQRFDFLPNYPNPFRRSTTFSFRLQGGGGVKLQIYDTLGREVANLVQRRLPAGQHEVTWTPRPGLANGVYISRLRMGGRTARQKMLLIR